MNRPSPEQAARLATATMYLSIATAILLLILAAAAGIKLGVRTFAALPLVVLFAGLYWARRRHDGAGGDKRLATALGAIAVLFGGGLAGGLACLVGQTFARQLVDPILERADLMLGANPEALIRGVVAIPGLPALLAAAYLSSFPLIFLTVLTLAWTRRSERAWELCAVFNLCLTAAAISSTVIPATGTFYYLHIPAELVRALPAGSGTYYLGPMFELRHARVFTIDPTKMQGVAVFPSFHMALALMTAAAWRDVRRARVPIAIWQGMVIVSAIPIGGHFYTDLVGGGLCWLAAEMLWQKTLAALSGGTRREADTLALA